MTDFRTLYSLPCIAGEGGGGVGQLLISLASSRKPLQTSPCTQGEEHSETSHDG